MNLLCQDKNHYSRTVSALLTYCSSTIHAFKNIKNRFYGIIHTFKNYFAIVFSIFNFSKNKLYSNELLGCIWEACFALQRLRLVFFFF